MIKWFAYIVMLLIFAPGLLSAKIKNNHFDAVSCTIGIVLPVNEILADTVNAKKGKKQEQEDKKKVKEVAKAKRQPKPEKIESGDNPEASKPKTKPKRQRRPEGLERPPEIPRRNGN
jgi:outer membrane biosynthesis protein TonB